LFLTAAPAAVRAIIIAHSPLEQVAATDVPFRYRGMELSTVWRRLSMRSINNG